MSTGYSLGMDFVASAGTQPSSHQSSPTSCTSQFCWIWGWILTTWSLSYFSVTCYLNMRDWSMFNPSGKDLFSQRFFCFQSEIYSASQPSSSWKRWSHKKYELQHIPHRRRCSIAQRRTLSLGWRGSERELRCFCRIHTIYFGSIKGSTIVKIFIVKKRQQRSIILVKTSNYQPWFFTPRPRN